MIVQVARLGKPHGIRGDVTALPMTDDPELRFVPGAEFATEPASAGPLVVRNARWNKDILLLSFEGVDDRNAAEELRGVKLFAAAVEDDDEGWYEHELVGLAVLVDGERRGVVSALLTMPAQDLLEVTLDDGTEVLVPFVDDIVPEVDINAGTVLITPPPGLFELNSPEQDQ